MTQDQSLSGEIVIPESITYNEKEYLVTSLTSSAFKGCERLSSMVLPNSITTLGDKCFENCRTLKSIILPNNAVSVGKNFFYGCSGLESVILPNNITSLGETCFYSCRSLKKAVLPSSLTTIGTRCFQECTKLASITLPNSVISLGEACFLSCTSLESIILPNSITTLEDYCFSRCENLVSITLPSSITTLGVQCFYGCHSLASILLPKSIITVKRGCFEDCRSLLKVECNWTDLSDLTFGTGIFSGIFSQAKLYVPRGTKELYASTEPWASSFSAIIEKENGGEEPETPQCAAPSVSFANGQLAFTSETEGAEFHYTLQTPDAKNEAFAEDGTIDLSCQYDITVWASADGYTNSETTKATIFFIDATIESETTDIPLQSAKRGIVITMTSNGLAMSGLNAGELVEVYNLQGVKLAQSQATNGTLLLKIPSSNGFVMLKVGNETIKVRL